MTEEPRDELRQEELEEQNGELLPEREQMSLINSIPIDGGAVAFPIHYPSGDTLPIEKPPVE